MPVIACKLICKRANVRIGCWYVVITALSMDGDYDCGLREGSKERAPYHIIEECHRKIRLNVNITNAKKTPEGFEYIYVKEVHDSSTGVKVRLLNPIVLRLRQDQVVLAYPFKYVSAVNGKITEVVVNRENTKNYTGCDDTSPINPTCGLKFERGKAVAYSEGFCCFCPEQPVNRKQTRGGQDCSHVEPDLEKQNLKASAHCLQFSDIWYSIVASYYTANPQKGTVLISADDNRLLIPQPLPGVTLDKLPLAVKNGATDYLLIKKSVINPVGDECDMAGISFEGFAKQKDRCEAPKNTCLKNQPLDFWDADDKKRKSGGKGVYLLENYGSPYKDPIIIDKETKEHWLAIEYYDEQQTVLTIEFNADQIVALTPGRHIQISKVISSSKENKITFNVFLSNKDLAIATIFTQAIDCKFGVPIPIMSAK
ncbi:hypothetical protein CEXT_384561 [Caerostris extrusa]|uniref:Generative cell specific-1/HAP2 domain-containing protein n=1 Tax=Caerostris extrusa TaxID=172846 RepID=A0AAV4RSD3_CAEEX|nr:hypothetical protein CEXT_384561 [Caerostris extrusa]